MELSLIKPRIRACKKQVQEELATALLHCPLRTKHKTRACRGWSQTVP
eukprot:COSAG06_NODE_61293_length_268_cov_0.609467_1_plen_47_part_10